METCPACKHGFSISMSVSPQTIVGCPNCLALWGGWSNGTWVRYQTSNVGVFIMGEATGDANRTSESSNHGRTREFVAVFASGQAQIKLDYGVHLIGRGMDVDVYFPDATMSRRHAEIDVTERGVTIRDLVARNGTRVNGGVVETCDLTPGDSILLGSTELVFVSLETETGEVA